MRKLILLKSFSLILLTVMLVVTVHGLFENVSATQNYVTAASDSTSYPGISASHRCPCDPLEQHNDYDNGCDTCINCACHAPFAIQQSQLNYNPTISDLPTSDPIKRFPEVYLSKFIPPHNLA